MGDKYFPVYSVKPKKYGIKPAEYSDYMMKTNSRAENRLQNEQHQIDRARQLVTKDIAREKTLLQESYRKTKTSVPLSSYRQLETVRPRTITGVTTPRQRVVGGRETSRSLKLTTVSSGDTRDVAGKTTFVTQPETYEPGKSSAIVPSRSKQTDTGEKQEHKEQMLVQGSKIT